MAVAETARLIASLELKDKFSGAAKKITNSLGNIEKKTDTTGKRIGVLGHAAGTALGVGIERGAEKAIGAITGMVTSAGDFEASLNTINTVAKVNADDLKGIGDGIRALSRETGTTTEDLSSAYYDLVSAGISAADAQNVLTQANTLAIGGLGTTAETVDLLTTAINSYGGDASKAKEYTDQFAVAIANGKVTAADLAANFADVGPLAAAMGVGIDQISASIGNMTAKGTHAPEAFTQIRAAMVALQRQTPALKKVMKSLGIENIQTELDSKGLAGTWDELRTKAEELGIPIIKMTGRVEGQQYVLQNTGDALDGYNKNLEDVKGASQGAGEAAEQMAERQKGLNYSLGRLKANLKDAGLTIGTALIPKLVELSGKFTTFLSGHQEDVKKFADSLATGFSKAADLLVGLPWDAIGGAFKLMGGGAKVAMDAFGAAPSWLQEAIITGWGLDKLTGGAVHKVAFSLVGEGIKGLAGDLFKRGGSPAAPLYVADVSGGLGGGGGVPGAPLGGGKSVGSKALGILGGLTVAGFVAAIAEETHPMVQQAAEDVHDAVFSAIPKLGVEELEWPFGPKNTPTILPEVFGGNGLLGGTSNAPKAPLAPVAGTLGSKPLPVADPILAGIEKRNASEYNRTITGNLAKTSTAITRQIISHAASERSDLRKVQDATRRTYPALERIRNAASDAASAGRTTASRTAQAVERMRGVESASRATSANTDAIKRKNFSPTVDVNVHNAFSISNIINAQKTFSYVTATGRVGGKII